MRRSLTARIATLVFVTFMATAPAFASPRRDDSPIDGIQQTISRFFEHIIKILDLVEANPPR